MRHHRSSPLTRTSSTGDPMPHSTAVALNRIRCKAPRAAWIVCVLGLIAGRQTPAQSAQGAPASDELRARAHTELATEARLETILSLALTRNPGLVEARQQVKVARLQPSIGSRLPDAELKYELWGAPLLRPHAWDEADAHLFGVRQLFPAAGSLAAKQRALGEEAHAQGQSVHVREQDIALAVKREHVEYCRAEREYQLHLEHVELAQQILDLVRAAYQSGLGTQQDVLRTMVELSRLHNDVIVVDRERKTARASLNTLMGRPPEADLGPPPALDPAELETRAQGLAAGGRSRPELAAVQHLVRARESELEAARAVARWPSVMAGVDYWYVPLFEQPHAYGGMVSINLPWLNPRRSEEVRAAEATLVAERNKLRAVENDVRFELHAAALNVAAARQSYVLIQRDLLPQTEHSLQAAQAAYRGGQGDSLGLLDALRVWLDVRVERERALAQIATSLAEAERASGSALATRARGTR